MTGKIAIVTGGYVGLGLETTRALVLAGATVIVGYRTEEKAKKNLLGLKVELAYLDLQHQASIIDFAEKFVASGRPLHILINNAAIMASPLLRDVRGYEAQFSTNVLGHFVLTAKLWPALVKAGRARVVNVSSRGHFYSPVVFDDWNFEKRPYDPWQSYGQSKTGNILFTVALDARGESFGVRSFALHPGAIVATDLGRFQDPAALVERLKAMGMADEAGNVKLDPMNQLKTAEQGAATQVWAATSPFLEGKGGLYLENSNVAPLASDIVSVSTKLPINAEGFYGVQDYAIDPAEAQKLWALCEKLTGVQF